MVLRAGLLLKDGPDGEIERVEVRAVGWPFVLLKKVDLCVVEPLLCALGGVTRRAILGEQEGLVIEELLACRPHLRLQYLLLINFGVDFDAFVDENEVGAGVGRDACPNHHP